MKVVEIFVAQKVVLTVVDTAVRDRTAAVDVIMVVAEIVHNMVAVGGVLKNVRMNDLPRRANRDQDKVISRVRVMDKVMVAHTKNAIVRIIHSVNARRDTDSMRTEKVHIITKDSGHNIRVSVMDRVHVHMVNRRGVRVTRINQRRSQLQRQE
jgi:hypothetical protein